MFRFTDPRQHEIPAAEDCLPGRESRAFRLEEPHLVLGTSLEPPWPDGTEEISFGMGCFWGAERMFWQLEGVHVTAAGYAGGSTPHPTYHEVCSGRTGHAEVVRVVFRPEVVGLETLLRTFWEGHDPTQGMRQGNDVGTQYRSCIHVQGAAQRSAAEASRAAFQERLSPAGYGPITTEIVDAPTFWFAEPEHQQYLARNPGGYCGLGGTGVACPVGLVETDA